MPVGVATDVPVPDVDEPGEMACVGDGDCDSETDPVELSVVGGDGVREADCVSVGVSEFVRNEELPTETVCEDEGECEGENVEVCECVGECVSDAEPLRDALAVCVSVGVCDCVGEYDCDCVAPL